MSRKGHQFIEEQLAEVKALQKEIKDVKICRKLNVLRLRMEGYTDREISRLTGYLSEEPCKRNT